MRGEFIDVGGRRLYYYAAGTRGAGDPLVLVHGFPTSSHLWSDLVPLLPRGHRVVVLDLLGYGRSDLGATAHLTLSSHIDRLLLFLDALGISRATLVGHHIGASIALGAAVRQPERIGHLGLLHPACLDAPVAGPIAVLKAFLPAARVLPRGLALRVIREEMEHWFLDPLRARHSVEQYLRPFSEPRGARALLDHLAALNARESQSISVAASSLAVPVAIVGGSADRAIPASVLTRLQRLIPGASLDILENVPHFSPEEAPERVSQLLERLVCR